jgi:methylmalonyl-CoA/ethylmalonyl-CoA epimerase
VCYEVNNVENVFEKLTEEMGYIPLFRPVPAVAFENKLICYLYKKEIGFIEIVNA